MKDAGDVLIVRLDSAGDVLLAGPRGRAAAELPSGRTRDAAFDAPPGGQWPSGGVLTFPGASAPAPGNCGAGPASFGPGPRNPGYVVVHPGASVPARVVPETPELRA